MLSITNMETLVKQKITLVAPHPGPSAARHLLMPEHALQLLLPFLVPLIAGLSGNTLMLRGQLRCNCVAKRGHHPKHVSSRRPWQQELAALLDRLPPPCIPWTCQKGGPDPALIFAIGGHSAGIWSGDIHLGGLGALPMFQPCRDEGADVEKGHFLDAPR